MNVLHIITGLNDGGAEAVLYRLCSNDKKHQYRVVSMMDSGKYGPWLERIGVPVACLGMRQGRLTATGLWRLWKLLRREQPDVVQTWMYHADCVGGVLARLAGIRRVFWGIHHTTLDKGKSSRTTMIIASLNAWLSSCVPEAIVCCAEQARKVHRALGYSAEKLVVIPNGYDLDQFIPDNAVRQRLRAELGVDGDTPLLGMVGRFDPQKNHENLLCALGLLKREGWRFRCALIGRGLDMANYDLGCWLKKYNLRNDVLLLGQRSDVPAMMNALDIHVLSSAFGEAFPNVLAEAMACGTPCVTTDVGDAALIVGDTGWVVPPGKPKALSQAIAAAVAESRNDSVWRERQEASRERIRHRFDITTMIEAYQTVWDRDVQQSTQMRKNVQKMRKNRML